MFRRSAVLTPAVALAVALATGTPAAPRDEPATVTVQHILIGFGKSVRGKEVGRTKKEARALAESLLERARAGESFDDLVKEYTDDAYPGIYTMTNFDAPLMARTYPRKGMAPAFGRISFGLEVGELGITKYHPASSPFGWHVIKRLE